MDFVNPYNIIEIPLLELILNLSIGVVFAVILSWLVSQSTRLVVDTKQYMPLFLLLIPTMILIITIIKSSIALSLGLVGALSIVRFRTPIKEPEELAYIFIAIAIGLGLGANQVMATSIGFLVICLVMLPSFFKRKGFERTQSCFIDILIEDADEPFDLQLFSKMLSDHALLFRLKRVVETDNQYEITLQVPKLDLHVYEGIKKELKKEYGKLEISIVDNVRVIT